MNVRTIRLSKGLSVPQLSRLTGMPIRTIEEIEKREKCTVSNAKKLAIALEVTLDELCDFQGSDNERHLEESKGG